MPGKTFVSVHFAATGDRNYSRGFYALASAVEDMTPVFERIASDIRDTVQSQFMTEGAAAGNPWAPLSPDYGAWKDAHYPGMPLLVRTGQMRHELLDPSAFMVGKQSLRYEPVSDIVIYHQFGTRHMPRRKVLAITEARERSWDHYWAEWLAAQRQAWLH